MLKLMIRETKQKSIRWALTLFEVESIMIVDEV